MHDLKKPGPGPFLWRVADDCLRPKYERGSFALIEPGVPAVVGDVVLVRLRSGALLLRRLLARHHGLALGGYGAGAPVRVPTGDVAWMYPAAHEVPCRGIEARYPALKVLPGAPA